MAHLGRSTPRDRRSRCVGWVRAGANPSLTNTDTDGYSFAPPILRDGTRTRQEGNQARRLEGRGTPAHRGMHKPHGTSRNRPPPRFPAVGIPFGKPKVNQVSVWKGRNDALIALVLDMLEQGKQDPSFRREPMRHQERLSRGRISPARRADCGTGKPLLPERFFFDLGTTCVERIPLIESPNVAPASPAWSPPTVSLTPVLQAQWVVKTVMLGMLGGPNARLGSGTIAIDKIFLQLFLLPAPSAPWIASSRPSGRAHLSRHSTARLLGQADASMARVSLPPCASGALVREQNTILCRLQRADREGDERLHRGFRKVER